MSIVQRPVGEVKDRIATESDEKIIIWARGERKEAITTWVVISWKYLLLGVDSPKTLRTDYDVNFNEIFHVSLIALWSLSGEVNLYAHVFEQNERMKDGQYTLLTYNNRVT